MNLEEGAQEEFNLTELDGTDTAMQIQAHTSQDTAYHSNDLHMRTGYEGLVGIGVAIGFTAIVGGAILIGRKLRNIYQSYLGNKDLDHFISR